MDANILAVNGVIDYGINLESKDFWIQFEFGESDMMEFVGVFEIFDNPYWSYDPILHRDIENPWIVLDLFEVLEFFLYNENGDKIAIPESLRGQKGIDLFYKSIENLLSSYIEKELN